VHSRRSAFAHDRPGLVLRPVDAELVLLRVTKGDPRLASMQLTGAELDEARYLGFDVVCTQVEVQPVLAIFDSAPSGSRGAAALDSATRRGPRGSSSGLLTPISPIAGCWPGPGPPGNRRSRVVATPDNASGGDVTMQSPLALLTSQLPDRKVTGVYQRF
jgi:hypothetical protein